MKQPLRVKCLNEESMDFLRERFDYGDVQFDEACLTLALIEVTRRVVDGPAYHDYSPYLSESLSLSDVRVALHNLNLLMAETFRTFGHRIKRKRARKRGAALRQRANAVFNVFYAKAVRRAGDRLMAETEKAAWDVLVFEPPFKPVGALGGPEENG